MKLSEAQQEFTRCIAKLIEYATDLGYGLTFGEAERPKWVAEEYARRGTGIANSVHTKRLAVDFNLFRDGEYLVATEDHRLLGAYWETLHDLARWGGHFNDGNHYSFEWKGFK